jgi:hypothetical protein
MCGAIRRGAAVKIEPMKVVSKICSGLFGESTGTIERCGRKNSALWRMAHVDAVEAGRGGRGHKNALRHPPNRSALTQFWPIG